MSETYETPADILEDAIKAPETSESMADYAAELEASFKKVREGDILTGTVINVSETEVTLDLKYYTEGIIRLEDYSSNQDIILKDVVHVGDEISATVIRTDDGQGHILLSSKEANDTLAWEKLKACMENGTNLTVKIGGVVKSGVIAYVEGIRGFIPASKLALGYVENLEDFLNKEIQVRVITVDPEKPYGAFIDLGNGLSGLVHVSQISEKRIKSPASVLNVGDKVKVKVINIKDGKLSLSMKALNEIAAEEIEEESYDLPQSDGLTTSLGSLFANIKL